MYKRNKRSPQLFLEEEKIMNFVEEYEIRKLKLTAIEQCIAANASDFLCSNTSRKVKRPSNQFIIFSTIYGKLLKDIVNEISTRIDIPNDAKKLLTQKLCSIVWNEMNKQEKSCFNTLAKQIKDQHTQRFPDYSFNPNKARNRNTCRFVPYNHIPTNNKNNSGNNNSGSNTSIETNLSEISQTQKSSQISFESQTSIECDRVIEHIESPSSSSSSSSSSTTTTPILSSSSSTSSSTPILEFSAPAANSTSIYSSLESMELPLLFFSPLGSNYPTPSLLSLPIEFSEFEYHS